ncbi:hypothetical protein Q3G72_018740 [Acer saccharum]|nr:hypothetical protein Q3G72_018740 [Acer saccharum]
MLVFPSALSCLCSLLELDLKGNNFESLSLKHFTSLTRLDISYCQRLKYLQEFPLPSRLEFVDASHCISLETLPDTTVVSTGEMDIHRQFQYYNCLKLDVKAIQTDAQTRIQLMANNVPETTSTSRREIWENICYFEISHDKTTWEDWEHPKLDHVFVKYSGLREVDSSLSSKYSLCQKVRFQFSLRNDCCKVKKCGVHLVYSEYKDESTESVDHDIAEEDQEEHSQKRIKQRNIVHEISLPTATPNQNQSAFDLFPSPRGGSHPSVEGKEKGISGDGDWKMVWVSGRKKEIGEDGDWKMVWVSGSKGLGYGEDGDWKKMMKNDEKNWVWIK